MNIKINYNVPSCQLAATASIHLDRYNLPAMFADVWNKKLRLRHVRNSNG